MHHFTLRISHEICKTESNRYCIHTITILIIFMNIMGVIKNKYF